jgi:hypothetical protein
MRAAIAALLVLFWTGSAWAQSLGDRPSEQDMFGGGSAPAPAPTPASPDGGAPPPADTGTLPPTPPTTGAPPAATIPPAAAAEGTDRDQAVLGNSGGGQFLSDYVAPENPLQIGGQLYLRMQSTASHTAPGLWSLSAPSLLDMYADARPNPRVRGFVLGRMSFDPTLPPGVSTGTNVAAGGSQTGTGVPTGFSSFSTTRGPVVLLDQMWIRFDVLEHVFVTAGKQHVRWGTGRFWQPTDYLHALRRNPLDVFDSRGGTTMLKLNVPWEEKAWNFYGFAVAENPNAPTPTLDKVAGAFRVEGVVAGVEVGADTYLGGGQGKARYGFDMSTGIYDFDVYADVGIRPGSDFFVYFPQQNVASGFDGYQTQAVGGVNYSRKYNDNDMWTAGVEYFYNHAGYENGHVYPQAFEFALSQQPQPLNPFLLFPFFYIGRHYGAVYITLPAPYSWNYTTFTLSTLGNFSDGSFVTRLDYSLTFLTHMSLEAFVDVHYGNLGGEFRFEVPAELVARIPGAPASLTSYPISDLGLALRLKI